jgi:hypothetical protein
LPRNRLIVFAIDTHSQVSQRARGYENANTRLARVAAALRSTL